VRLVLLGPPGVGKGTQARMLEAELGVPQVASGDLLRAAVRDINSMSLLADLFRRGGQLGRLHGWRALILPGGSMF